MSVLGTLALMVSAVTARLPKADTPDVEATRLKAQINQLTRELNEARFEADRWRSLARRWQARYEMTTEPFTQAQALAQANQAQHNAVLAQQHTQMYTQSARNALGAQNLNQGFDQFCNCVPARHDLLLSFSHLRLL